MSSVHDKDMSVMLNRHYLLVICNLKLVIGTSLAFSKICITVLSKGPLKPSNILILTHSYHVYTFIQPGISVIKSWKR